MSDSDKLLKQIPDYLHRSTLLSVVLTDLQGRYIYVNECFKQQYAYLNTSFIGEEFSNSVHPDDIAACNQAAERCINDPHEFVELDVRKPEDEDGIFHWTRWQFSLFLDTNNQPVGIFCVGHDLTREKFIDQALQDSERTLEAFYSSTSQPYILVDQDLKVRFFNKKAKSVIKMISNHSLDLDATIDIFIIREFLSDLRSYFKRALEGEKIQFEILIEPIYWRYTLFPVFDSDGVTLGVALNIEDVSTHRNYEKRVLEQNKILKDIAFQQSHEFRVPVANLLGVVGQLIDFEEALTPADKKFYYRAILSQAQRIDQIIQRIVEETERLKY